jgi:histone H3/H4
MHHRGVYRIFRSLQVWKVFSHCPSGCWFLQFLSAHLAWLLQNVSGRIGTQPSLSFFELVCCVILHGQNTLYIGFCTIGAFPTARRAGFVNILKQNYQRNTSSYKVDEPICNKHLLSASINKRHISSPQINHQESKKKRMSSEQVTKTRKQPSKKETENLSACHARNAIFSVKEKTHTNEESMELLAQSTQDYLVRIVQKAAKYADGRKAKQNTITYEDIVQATQEEPMVVPETIFDDFVPKERKPRSKKSKDASGEEQKSGKRKRSSASSEVTVSA